MEPWSALRFSFPDNEKNGKGFRPPKAKYLVKKNKKDNRNKAKRHKQACLDQWVATISKMKKLGKNKDDDQHVEDVSKEFLWTLHKHFDIHPLQHLIKKKIFAGQAAGKIETFIKESKKPSDESSYQSSDESSDESSYESDSDN